MNHDNQSQWILLSSYQNSKNQQSDSSMIQSWLLWIDSQRKHTSYHFMRKWKQKIWSIYSNNILLQIMKYLQKWYLTETYNSDQSSDKHWQHWKR